MGLRKLALGTFILFGLGIGGLEAQQLYLLEEEGNQSAYFLSDIRKISFTRGNITVLKIGGDTFTYALAETINLNFLQPTSVVQQPGLANSTGSIFIYPNPVKEMLFLQVSSAQTKPGTIEIISMEGKVVYSTTMNINSANYEIDMSGIPKGLYVLKVNKGSSFETAKFIKH